MMREETRGRRWPVLEVGAITAVSALVLLAFVQLMALATGYDLDAYLEAARRIAAGDPLYQAITQVGTFQPGPGKGIYLYAPPLAVMLLPLSAGPDTLAEVASLALHVGALVGACLVMPARRAVRLGALMVGALCWPVVNDTVLGNVSVLVMALAAVTWRWLDRPLASVAVAAAAFLRPTQALVVVWWLLRRQWWAVLWTLVAAALITIATLPIVGVDGWTSFARVLANLGDGLTSTGNSALGATSIRHGASRELAMAVQWLGYVVAIGAFLVGLRRDPETGLMVTFAASLLLSPLMWGHYLCLLLVPAAWMAGRGRVWPLASLVPLTWLPVIWPGTEVLVPIVAVLGTLLPLVPFTEAAPEALDGEVDRLQG